MKKGFTLVELLVVIAIIGILTAIITANFSTAKARARDAKRVSDIAQIQLALTYFFDRCNRYPAYLSVTSECQPGSAINLGTFISKIPTPPSSDTNPEPYLYLVNNYPTTVTPSDYIIVGKLETNNSIINDGLSAPISTATIFCVDESCSGSVDYGPGGNYLIDGVPSPDGGVPCGQEVSPYHFYCVGSK